MLKGDVRAQGQHARKRQTAVPDAALAKSLEPTPENRPAFAVDEAVGGVEGVSAVDEAAAFRSESACVGVERAGGILDPAKVVRVALEKATSTAAMILTTDAIVLTERMGGLEKRDGRGTLRGVDLEP